MHVLTVESMADPGVAPEGAARRVVHAFGEDCLVGDWAVFVRRNRILSGGELELYVGPMWGHWVWRAIWRER